MRFFYRVLVVALAAYWYCVGEDRLVSVMFRAIFYSRLRAATVHFHDEHSAFAVAGLCVV